MANFTLCFGNKADGATLSTGSWSTQLNLTNLTDYRLRKVARSTDALAASTKFRFALTGPTYIQALALAATNCSVNATYRWRLFSDAGFTTQIYDSGTLDLYPTGSMPASQIPTGAANFGTTKPLQEEADRFQNNIVHLLTTPMHARWGDLQITDTGNPDGYVEAGRLFVGQVFRPVRNHAYGDISFRPTSRTRLTRARDGTSYYSEERPDFCIPVAFKWLTEDEAMRLLDLQVHMGLSGEVLAIWNADQVAYWWRRQIFGRLKELNPVEHPLYATYAAAFQVEGTL